MEIKVARGEILAPCGNAFSDALFLPGCLELYHKPSENVMQEDKNTENL